MDICNQLHAPADFRPVKEPLYPLDRGLGLDSYGEDKSLLPLPEFGSRTFQPVASHYTDYAIQ